MLYGFDGVIDINQISEGFHLANKESSKYLSHDLAQKMTSSTSFTMLKNVAYTQMLTKLLPDEADFFAEIATDVWTRHTSSSAFTSARNQVQGQASASLTPIVPPTSTPPKDSTVKVLQFVGAADTTNQSKIIDGKRVFFFINNSNVVGCFHRTVYISFNKNSFYI